MKVYLVMLLSKYDPDQQQFVSKVFLNKDKANNYMNICIEDDQYQPYGCWIDEMEISEE